MPSRGSIAIVVCLAGALYVTFATSHAHVHSIVACGGRAHAVPRLASNRTSFDPEGVDCPSLLQQFRADEIVVAKREGDVHFRRSFVAISKARDDANQSFYVATHDKGIDGVRAGIMQYQYYYERKLSELVANTFDRTREEGREALFLDVGANIGWFSLVAAAHGATKVYSFEPNLQNTIRFCESLSLNGWASSGLVVPVAKGVGNVEEERELHAVSANNPGSFSFREGSGGAVVGKMSITTLDAFAERHGWFDARPSIAFFKLDVERFEKEVIEGAERLLKSRIIETIAMELQPAHSEEAKLRICGLLYDAGYELVMHGRWMGPDTEVNVTYANASDLVKDLQEKKYGENVVFRLKDEAAVGAGDGR